MEQQKDIVKKVLNFIEENIEKDINLDKIARSVGYSKFYLNRIFSESTGVTIYKYLQSRRLTIAAEKLVKSDAPITQIAYEAGYDSQQSFTLAFKQLYLHPPKTYRNISIFEPKQNRIYMYGTLYHTKYISFFRKREEMAA